METLLFDSAGLPLLYGDAVSPTGQGLLQGGGYRTGFSTQSLNYGGPTNPLSGMGGPSDKGDATFWVPSWQLNFPNVMETLYVQSWAAAKLVDIPVDDQWIMGREYDSEDEAVIKTLEELEETLRVADRVGKAMKAARLHGSAILIMVTKEAPLETELDITRIKEGDLVNLLHYSRHEVKIENWVSDIYDNNYGEPLQYSITPSIGTHDPYIVHHSRVIRFDGRQALSSDGWTNNYDRDWGISELANAITELGHDAAFIGAIAHMGQEASIPVVKTQAFENAIAGRPRADEPTLAQLGAAINMGKSVFRTMFLGVNDDFARVGIPFGGMADLVNSFAMRLAAMAGIPATRFLSQSPAGMNSTGESDMINYRIHVAALQIRMLTPRIRPLGQGPGAERGPD